MNKPRHEILEEVHIAAKEVVCGGLKGTVIGIKRDPHDNSLWMYQVEVHVHEKWVHQDFVHKKGEMKTGLDDGPPGSIL